MKTLTGHQTNECNEAITITADEPDEKYGNASHNYRYKYDTKEGFTVDGFIQFQRGPIKEVGVNGLTNEALLAIMIDRMDGFQSGRFACDENDVAREHLLDAMAVFKLRTKARVARGVEGTNVK